MSQSKPFTIHGGFGGGMNVYSSNEDRLTRDPFSWNLHGNLTPSFYGFSIPLSFSVTQFSKSYTTPFSRFGLSPTYKWAKLHLGYRSISFSPLVFDGESFLGVGTELNPGKFYFAGFYGRLNKAISEDTTLDRHIEPQYARKGYGLKIGLKEEKKEIYLQYFNAKDDVASINRYDDTLSSVNPESNNIIGTSWRFKILEFLDFSGDVALSAWNRDMRYGGVDSIGDELTPGYARVLKIPVTNTSSLSWSGQAQLSANLSKLNLMLGYQRVEPDFKSLGIPYMLNDMEIINANAGSNFLNGKINVNAGFTTQRNNLRDMLSSTLTTKTGNFSTNAFVNQHVNLNANVILAKIYQKDGLEKLSDSTRMDQLMLTTVFTPSFNFFDEKKQHTISGNLSYTNLNDYNPLTTDQLSGKNINISSNYALFFLQKYFGLNGGVQYNTYLQKHSTYSSIGVNVGANAQVLKSKALSLQGSVGYFMNKASNSPAGNNTTFSFNANYRTAKHHTFGFYTNYILTPPVNLNPLNNIYNVPYAVNSKMFSGGLNYSYNF